MGKICVLCGKPSGIYPLCKEHLQMKADGKVIKCEDCGTWHFADKPCTVCGGGDHLIKNSPKANNEIQKDEDDFSFSKETSKSNLTCIICGENSNGKHFCRNCYNKYKERSVDIRITHCTDTEILDEYGNLTYKCADGRKVRSRAEAMISDWLYHNKIRSVYEEPEIGRAHV